MNPLILWLICLCTREPWGLFSSTQTCPGINEQVEVREVDQQLRVNSACWFPTTRTHRQKVGRLQVESFGRQNEGVLRTTKQPQNHPDYHILHWQKVPLETQAVSPLNTAVHSVLWKPENQGRCVSPHSYHRWVSTPKRPLRKEKAKSLWPWSLFFPVAEARRSTFRTAGVSNTKMRDKGICRKACLSVLHCQQERSGQQFFPHTHYIHTYAQYVYRMCTIHTQDTYTRCTQTTPHICTNIYTTYTIHRPHINPHRHTHTQIHAIHPAYRQWLGPQHSAEPLDHVGLVLATMPSRCGQIHKTLLTK